MMQNAGLPEAGDMVITFAPDVLADSERYTAAAALPPGEQTTHGSGSAARARRDAAVTAFGALRSGGTTALAEFHRAAAQIVRPHLDRFASVWTDGPARASAATGEQLVALAAGDASHLADASVHRLPPPADERRMGCCGTLGTYIPA
jgi:hypothetical protein